jgi:hypothetical protein
MNLILPWRKKPPFVLLDVSQRAREMLTVVVQHD